MKNWKKNAILAAVLVFVCAGIYMNWQYTESAAPADLMDTLDTQKILDDSTLVMNQTAMEDLEVSADEFTDYFAAVRLSRQESRDNAVSMLQEAMAYVGSDPDQAVSAELEEIIATALCEAQIESLIIAKGYTDCVAYMTDQGIALAVSAPIEGFSEEEVALLSDIVLTQADYSLEDIRIIEVKG